MTLVALAPGWLAAFLILLLTAAAVQDGLQLRISNLLSGAVAISALVAMALSDPGRDLWQNFLLFALVLSIGTFLFASGIMGGGDIKLLAAAALWFDLTSGWKLLVVIALVGGVEALLLILLRRLRWSQASQEKFLLLRRGEGIPYGIAIALGVALLVIVLRY